MKKGKSRESKFKFGLLLLDALSVLPTRSFNLRTHKTACRCKISDQHTVKNQEE